MDDLFVHTLQDIYYAEKSIVGALPDMISKATASAARGIWRDDCAAAISAASRTFMTRYGGLIA